MLASCVTLGYFKIPGKTKTWFQIIDQNKRHGNELLKFEDAFTMQSFGVSFPCSIKYVCELWICMHALFHPYFR